MSDDRTIYVTTADMARLQALLARQKNAGEALEKLAAELDRAGWSPPRISRRTSSR